MIMTTEENEELNLLEMFNKSIKKEREEIMKEIDQQPSTERLKIRAEVLRLSEREYSLKKQAYAQAENTYILTTKWVEVNKKLIKNNEPQLTNDKMRQAYIDTLLTKAKQDLNTAKLHYLEDKRNYEMEKLIYAKQDKEEI